MICICGLPTPLRRLAHVKSFVRARCRKLELSRHWRMWSQVRGEPNWAGLCASFRDYIPRFNIRVAGSAHHCFCSYCSLSADVILLSISLSLSYQKGLALTLLIPQTARARWENGFIDSWEERITIVCSWI